MRKLLLIACLLLGASSIINAQDYFKKDTVKTTENVFIIRLKDGTRLKGRIIEQNTEQSKIQTQNMGLVTVAANQIVSMELDKNQSVSDKNYFENRFVNRFVFTPSGFAMEKGSIEYYNYMFYYSEFAAALGSRFSLGLGFITILPTEGYNLKVKGTLVSNEKFNFSVTGNLIGGRTVGNTTAIIPSLSFGRKESFFNVSPIFFTENRTGSFGLSVGYMKKASPTLTFFTENFFAVGSGVNFSSGAVLSGGLRFDRLRHAFDLNVIIPTNTGSNNFPRVYLIPTVGYHLKLSK